MALTIDEARGWYQEADPVHDFAHVLRVLQTAEKLAEIEGADQEIIRAAALLHDAEGSAPGTETRASHHQRSAEFAGEVLRAKGWPEVRIAAVQHCILAHRFRSAGEAPESLEAKVLFDADKLDVLGAIGAVRVVVYAALNHQPVYAAPSEKFLQSGEKEPGEPHSAYHEFLFKLIKVRERLYTESARQMGAGREAYLRGFFEQLAAEMKGNL